MTQEYLMLVHQAQGAIGAREVVHELQSVHCAIRAVTRDTAGVPTARRDGAAGSRHPGRSPDIKRNPGIVIQTLCRIIVLALCAVLVSGTSLAQTLRATHGNYTHATPTRDGTGKYYFGREIARVMGHRGAGWLERKSRTNEEAPDQAVRAMHLSPDAVVADIGAGTGYFSFRMAALVPAGRVYAVDIQPEMLDIIRKRMQRRSVQNVIPVQGEPDDPVLPEHTVDAVLLVDAYHEFAYPYEMMRGIVRSLRPGGKVFLIEYRGEDPRIPIKPLHKMTQQQAIAEMQAIGLVWVETRHFLPTQHFMIFEKPD